MNWTTYKPSKACRWNLQRVVHLHRRAGLGATWSEIQRDLGDGPQAAIDHLLDGPNRLQSATDFERMAGNISSAATASNNIGRLQAWWFFRMLRSPDPLGERLTLMWHNHFATSNRKVEDLPLMLGQNQVLRNNARGGFGDLLRATLKDGAMLKWLDADANRKGHPNENLARELFELFALGIGNYNEQDVLAAAKALTGWSTKDGSFFYRDTRHDDSEIELFGQRERLDGDQLIDRTLSHPATPKRLAWRLCKTFLGEGMSSGPMVSELAEIIAKQNLDINKAVKTVLRSEHFFSDDNLRNRIVGPAELVVSTIHSLELKEPPPSTMHLADWSARMGQDLFHPPNVGGWNEGRAWLGSRAIIARSNFASAIATGGIWRSRNADDVELALGMLLEKHNCNPDHAAAWLTKLLLGVENQLLAESVASEGCQTKYPSNQ